MDKKDSFSEEKLKIIEPFLKKEKKLKEIEEESSISYATLKRWVKAYKEKGVKGLTKKERSDKNNFKKVDEGDLEHIETFYEKNKNLSISTLYKKYSDSVKKFNISYPTFYRIINNLDSFVKKDSKKYLKVVEKNSLSYGIFQFPLYIPAVIDTIFYITLYFEMYTLKITNFTLDDSQKSFKKLYPFIRESIVRDSNFPKEVFLTNTITEASKKSLRECSFETNINFVTDEDFDTEELKKFCYFIELDISHEFYGKSNLTAYDIQKFLELYIFVGEEEKSPLEFYFMRKLDFFLTKSLRKVNKGSIRLKNNLYFDEILNNFEDDILEIRHSQYDELFIVVYDKKSDFLCIAEKIADC
ncbi:MAG: helix-turn-helix domain-containing protein [Fusobacteriaceae bacterium]|nr:helix-turn-helix domain-containing protein [Fusobacteriaceae bacterium]MBN2838085.1 helix-turn-helix domain-containing protein [Fusobacteriaceae bacterium]